MSHAHLQSFSRSFARTLSLDDLIHVCIIIITFNSNLMNEITVSIFRVSINTQQLINRLTSLLLPPIADDRDSCENCSHSDHDTCPGGHYCRPCHCFCCHADPDGRDFGGGAGGGSHHPRQSLSCCRASCNDDLSTILNYLQVHLEKKKD